VLTEGRPGKSHALNTGIAAAEGSCLVFLDADDRVAPGYLQAMSDGLDRHEMVSGRMDTTVLNPVWAQGVKLREDGLTGFLDWHVMVGGGLLGIRADVRKRVGDFDPDFWCGEDVDFTWRAALLDVDTAFLPDAVLYVRRPLTVREAFAKGRAYGRSHVELYVRFRDDGQPRRSRQNILGHAWATVSSLVRPGDHRLWYFALEGGTIWGRAEQSVRRRVLYP
jgi:GT2 family glycosyltransferase